MRTVHALTPDSKFRGFMILSLLTALGTARPAVCPAQAPPPAPPRRAVTVDDMQKLKALGYSPQISPDGRHILFTVTVWEWPDTSAGDGAVNQQPVQRTHLWMVRTDGSAPGEQITFGPYDVWEPRWSPDGQYFSYISTSARRDRSEGLSTPQIWLRRVQGGVSWPLTQIPDGVSFYEWAPDSRRIAFTRLDPLAPAQAEAQRRKDEAKDDAIVHEAEGRYTHLWTVDVITKQLAQLTHGTAFSVAGNFSWSPDATRLAFSGRRTEIPGDGRLNIYIVTVATQGIERITSGDHSDYFRNSGGGWSPDGRTIAFLRRPNNSPPGGNGLPPWAQVFEHLMLYDVATGQLRDAYDGIHSSYFLNVWWTPNSQRLLLNYAHRAGMAVVAYEPAANRYVPLLVPDTAAQRVITLASMSKDGSRLAVMVQSPISPHEVHVTDATFRSFNQLTRLNPHVAELALGETQLITWTSSDGWEVEGILIKPVGYRPGERYPLLVTVHGGPASRVGVGFQARYGQDGQLWAGRGWAVLIPNFRGSTGYGEPFFRAHLGDWGGSDYRDIMAGVDEVIRRGIADSTKLAVRGASFGGYMTAWTVSQTSRFKAAVMGVGMTNLISYYGTSSQPYHTSGYLGGPPDSERRISLYVASSPLTHVDAVQTPLLIWHGLEDTAVPVGQSLEFYRALKDRGKTVELVLYPREGHGVAEYTHQRDLLRREYEWISKYTLGME